MESAFEQAKKKKEGGQKGFDVRFADELASGLRSGTTTHEQFLRAVGESRMIQKKGDEERKKKEDNEFVQKTRADHEKGVKIELKAILKGKLAFPTSETILKLKKKKKKDDDSEPELDETKTESDELRKLGEKWEKTKKDSGEGKKENE
ncbi:MAG: hypothetical protein V1909_05735 [Candidatus Micrarchaeota archaeon]